MVDNDGNRNIFMNELQGMINNLDDSIKIPFEMHCDGFKYQEIADELDLPLGTVKSRIFFARKELKEKMRIMYGDIYAMREKHTA
jgi:RNA polymerase sigma-70 factor (ECF subfamily)